MSEPALSVLPLSPTVKTKLSPPPSDSLPQPSNATPVPPVSFPRRLPAPTAQPVEIGCYPRRPAGCHPRRPTHCPAYDPTDHHLLPRFDPHCGHGCLL
ncbi:hypothetical protein FH972_011354 [Carpinus fangiana]|uniref:Uncharacterized protein n=1 Tax=Carpinus fangiana TaxID=176857 RepID=A0A660KY06_9ROSI|nr:hypothetical protein FH972_011354 [Carpinus fangiana]